MQFNFLSTDNVDEDIHHLHVHKENDGITYFFMVAVCWKQGVQ